MAYAGRAFASTGFSPPHTESNTASSAFIISGDSDSTPVGIRCAHAAPAVPRLPEQFDIGFDEEARAVHDMAMRTELISTPGSSSEKSSRVRNIKRQTLQKELEIFQARENQAKTEKALLELDADEAKSQAFQELVHASETCLRE